MRRTRHRLGPALIVVATVTAVAACGSGSHRLGAAEPATAPPLTALPVGSVASVGAHPEGIVYDSDTNLVAVAVRDPDRLQLLDPSTLRVRRSVPLPGDARHLQLGRPGGPVLVPLESAGQIGQVTLPGGTLTVTDVGKQPHDAAELANGDVVIGNEFGKSISIVRDGHVVTTIADLTQPGGVIADGDTVGVVDVGAFTLSTYDATTERRTGRVSAGKGPTHGVLIGSNRMLVADTRGDAVLVFSVSPLRQVGRLSLPGTPYGLAVDRTTHTVWVTLTALNQVVGLNVATDTPRVVARYDTVRQPNTVAVQAGGARLWVTGTDGGLVQLIDR